MNRHLVEHQDRKQRVIKFLNETMDILRQQDKEQSAEALGKLAENVKQGLFSIVLVGEFSAGKSTFLNALMGKRILPSFTSETTATVNFLRHTEKAPHGEAGIVYYNDGHKEEVKELNVKSIAEVVSTNSSKGKDAVAATIDHVDLFLESEYLKNGIMLVDSPGLNGIAANHLEITRKQIEQSHAAIFMFSADHPGSKSDFEHLEELKSKSKNIFFVLNKINVINPSEGITVEDVVNDLKESYHKKFPMETEIPKIWPVAANAALVARDVNYQEYQNGEIVASAARRAELEAESRMGDFESRLMEYLTTGERTRDQLLQPVNTSLELLKEVKHLLEDEEQVLANEEPPEKFLEEKDALEGKIKELEQERANISEPVRTSVDSSIKILKARVGEKLGKIEDNVLEEIKYLEDPKDIREFAMDLEDVLNKKYATLIRNIKDDVYEEMVNVVQDKCVQYLSELDEQFSIIHDKASDINLHKRFELKEINLTANIEQIYEQISDLDSQIAELKSEGDEYEMKIVEAQQQEHTIQDLKAKKKELEDRRDRIMDNTIIPPIETIREEEEYWRDRNGLGGAIAQLFAGKKKDTKKVERKDSSAHDQAINERNEKIKIIDEKHQEVKDELKNATKPKLSSASLKLFLERTERRQEELNKKIETLNLELQKNINVNSNKECKALMRQIKTYLGERGEALEDILKEEINGQKKEYLQIINDLIAMNIENELKKHKAKIEKIIEAINTEGEDRNNKLAEIKAAQERITEVMRMGAELSADLETTLQNSIEQESLA